MNGFHVTLFGAVVGLLLILALLLFLDLPFDSWPLRLGAGAVAGGAIGTLLYWLDRLLPQADSLSGNRSH